MIKAIIFDCFGVLYPEASGNFFKRYRELFSANPAFLQKLNSQIDLGKISRAEFFTALEKEIKMPSEKIRTEIDQELIPNQELVALIRKLKENYKIGLLSNAGQEEIEIIYKDQLNNVFDSITVSYEAGILKPNPEIYLLCAQRLGVQPQECLFIDDRKTNVESAIKSGMQGLVYTKNAKLIIDLAKLGVKSN